MPQSNKWAGTVLLTTKSINNHDIPCIILFENIDGNRGYEFTCGTYESRHKNLLETARQELFEETAGLINVSEKNNILTHCPMIKTNNSELYFIRIDNIKKEWFDHNLKYLKIQSKNLNYKLKSFTEMNNIIFVPLYELLNLYNDILQNKPIKTVVKIINGKKYFVPLLNDIRGNKYEVPFVFGDLRINHCMSKGWLKRLDDKLNKCIEAYINDNIKYTQSSYPKYLNLTLNINYCLNIKCQ